MKKWDVTMTWTVDLMVTVEGETEGEAKEEATRRVRGSAVRIYDPFVIIFGHTLEVEDIRKWEEEE